MVYPLAPDGLFWAPQGEGAMSGEPMAFVRLAGCSVGCSGCDTDYRVARRLDVSALVIELLSLVPSRFVRPWVWVTGGEPTDHNLLPLVTALHARDCLVAVATSGVRAVPRDVDWVSVSPHGPLTTFTQTAGHELKVTPGLNRLQWGDIEPFVALPFPHKFVQPLAGDLNSTQLCVEFALTHPGWRVSLQAHKTWGSL